MTTALGRRDLLTGLLVASPLLALPFSRSYALFSLALIVVGLLSSEVRAHWRHQAGVLWAAGATGLPVLLTMLVLGLQQGAIPGLGVEKLAVIAAATLLALALAGLLDRPGVRRVAAVAITLTVAFWVADGLLQLLVGFDLFGIPAADEFGPDRVRAFFTKATRYGYYVGFLLIPPAFWLLSRPGGRWLAALLAVAGAVVVFAAGSRYAMFGYGFFLLVFVPVAACGLPPRPRLALLLGAPVGLLLLVTLMFTFNQSFQSRLLQTAVVLQQFDRATVNQALSLRLDVWEPALAMAAERWAVGYGPSEFERQVDEYLAPDSPFAGATRIMHAHQVLLEILLGTGMVGLAAFLAYYAWLLRYLWQRRYAAATFGWGCLLAYLLLWLPFGSQKDFYGSEQLLVSFYLLGLGFGCCGHRAAAGAAAGVPETAPAGLTGWPVAAPGEPAVKRLEGDV
jgi:O-antigen ligase